MSLFGDEPDEFTSPRSRPGSSALFDDTPSKQGSSSLFADDGPDLEGSDSPWAMPTPKKANGRQSMIKNMLADAPVPEEYIDVYDALIAGQYDAAGSVSLDGLQVVLTASEIGAKDAKRISDLLGSRALGRQEFNVFMALVGLSREGEDVTLDTVDVRRQSLPRVNVEALLAKLSVNDSSGRKTLPEQQEVHTTSPIRKAAARKASFGLDSDPWASPEMHRSHAHTTQKQDQRASSQPNDASKNSTSGAGVRTTSTFTTHPADARPRSQGGLDDPTANEAAGWGDGGATGAATFGTNAAHTYTSGAQTSSFGSAGRPGNHDRDANRSRTTNGVVEEVVKVETLPDKEGLYFFQHRNYEVSSVRRGSKVVRRYSDFVWLLDCLHKRYPFRQLPLLPPKRVAINGNHIAADNSFVEKRRKGLSRFVNALVRHPVLSQEQLVTMFLSVPTELAVWRKQATISVQEEFAGKDLPQGLEDSLSPQLQELFDTVRAGVQRSCDIYINLCSIVERLARRHEGVAAEYLRCASQLQSLVEVSSQTYAADTNNVPMLNGGISATAKHMGQGQALLEDQSREWDNGVLEDLKRQRDCLVSVRDMFDRRDKYDKDNIPQLEKRVDANKKKLEGLRTRPETKPSELEKVEEAILKDEKSIVAQHARSVFIKECIRDEIQVFQSSQFHVSRLYQDWSQEQVKYAELQADNWRVLSEEVEVMPLGDS